MGPPDGVLETSEEAVLQKDDGAGEVVMVGLRAVWDADCPGLGDG